MRKILEERKKEEGNGKSQRKKETSKEGYSELKTRCNEVTEDIKKETVQYKEKITVKSKSCSLVEYT